MSGTDLTSAANVRRLSTADISKLNKDNLKTALNAILNDNTVANDAPGDQYVNALLRLENKFDNMERSITSQLRGEINSLRADHELKISKIREENASLREALLQHQRYLESIESEKRAANIIVMGVCEGGDLTHNGETARDDKDKCDMILKHIGCVAPILSTTRIGKQPADPNRNRPIKVQLVSADVRSTVLSNSKKLKEAPDPLKKVYIKKDQHPVVRRELNRLYDVVKSERGKAGNQGRTVEFDKEHRCVTVDGEVIDRFRAQFF